MKVLGGDEIGVGMNGNIKNNWFMVSRICKAMLSLLICLSGALQINAQSTQDSLRFENLSCVNPANGDIQEGVVFSMVIKKEKKTEWIEMTIENYPNYLEPIELVFGRTVNLGAATVVWMSSGAVSLSRETKGTRWVFLFGAPKPEKTIVACQMVKVSEFAKDIQQYQLAFATEQATQLFDFLKGAVDRNIIKQMKQ